MSTTTSARLADIDANIQACMREMEGLKAGTRLGVVDPGLQTGSASAGSAPDSGAQPARRLIPVPSRTKPQVAVPVGATVADAEKRRAADETLELENIKKKKVFDTILRYSTRDSDGGVAEYTKGYCAVINGYYVPVKYTVPAQEEFHERILQMKAFDDWCKNMDTKLSVTSIEIQSVDAFGPRIGFVKFSADVFDSVYTKVPSIIFMRGGAVAMLPVYIVEETGEKYTIVTKQARTAAGIAEFIEIPAGMIDDSNNFGGQAAKELKEELDVTIPQNHLFDLTDFIFKGTKTGVYPSVGGCDEFLRFYLYEHTLPEDTLNAMIIKMEAKILGNKLEGEKITMKFVKFKELMYVAPDMKALSAIALYSEFDRQRNAFVEKARNIEKMVNAGLELEFERFNSIGSEFEKKKAQFVSSNVNKPDVVGRGLTEKFKSLHEASELSAKAFEGK